jgi:nitrite reductase/ring-hydroxylating ferredoxin subunit
MTMLAELKARLAKIGVDQPRSARTFQLLPRTAWSGQRPTYDDAKPSLIHAALRRSQRRPSGNWYAFAASDTIGKRPVSATVGGIELVAWRGENGRLAVGPASCPHLGADLSTGTVECGTLICPWHGLRFDGSRTWGWRPYPAHDDGVLAWVRLDPVGGESPTEAPILPRRPDEPRLSAVMRLVGTCEPRDVIANRLDPWHGAWFHPYSFTRLDVLSAPAAELPEDAGDVEDGDRFVVAVTFRIGRLGVPVIAEFTAPEPRTITMRIIDGEGAGSVVETHATPLGLDRDGAPRTAVIEAVIAHSDRPGFAHALKGAPLITPFIRHAATRLWRDDLAYAERLYRQRSRA